MIINIKSIDVLFFRDSKPFGRGSEHFTKSIFPPSSQTLYGALRTKVLEDLCCDYEEFKKGNFVFKNQELVNKIGLEKIKEEIGTVDKIGNFTLKGPFLLYDGDIFLKLPADVKKVGEENSEKYKILHPFNWSNFNIQTDFEINNYPHIITDEPIKDEEGYISLVEFTKYLLCEEIKDIKKSKEIFDYEMRTGIGVNPDTNLTKEGMLYTMGFVRLNKNWSLCAEIENLSILSESGLIKFGGMNRICEYTKLKDNPFKFYFNEIDKIKNLIEKSKIFKIILLTPALFNNGWISDKFEQIDGIKIKLLSAVIGRPENISGWDLAKNKAKPLRRLVPAGSIYYFELLEGGVGELFEKLNFVNFSDENSNLGFGLTLIGGVKNV